MNPDTPAPESLAPLTPQPSPGRPKKRQWLIVGLVVAVIIIAVIAFLAFRPNGSNKEAAATQPSTPSSDTPATEVQVVTKGLEHPWDIAFLPSGEALYVEREGRVGLLKDGKTTPVASIADVSAVGEGGLLGMTVDPAFAESRSIYTCYNTTANDMKVVRWKLSQDQKTLTDRKDIITGIPSNVTTFPGRHSGCRLAFGPDNNLWVGTGDVAMGDTSIRPYNLGGKVLRVDREGKAVAGNIEGDFDKRIFSYGHRNVQGLAFFPAEKNGVLGLSIEHGSSMDDEVNELKKGNFGWAPPAQGYDESVPMTDKQRFPEAIEAIWSSGNPTQAPSGGTILHGNQWKGWNGALAMAVLKDRHLKILRLDGQNKVTKEERVLVTEYGRLRTAVQGSDGNLYITTDNGTDDMIIKVTPQ